MKGGARPPVASRGVVPPEDELSPSTSGLAWLETLAFSAALPALGAWLEHDPWLLHGAFSWLAIAPLLAGLRYGFAHGFGSALLLSASMGLGWRYGALSVLPLRTAVGLLVVGMVSGEFCDMWRRRIERLRIETEYRRLRLDEFTHNFHLLKVSHDRLERQLAGSARSLRDALANLERTLAVAVSSDGPLGGLAGRIMEVFASHAWLQVASLFAVDADGRIGERLATLGQPSPVSADDPLLVEALRTGSLTSVHPHAAQETSFLAVIPMTDSLGRVRAVIAVEEMLFVAFHDDNLQLLAVLGAHIGDALAAGPALLDEGGNSEREFVWHLRRGIEDRRRFGLPFAVVAMALPQAPSSDLLADMVVAQRRSLDRLLLEELGDGRRALLVLLPVTDQRGVEGYFARFDQQLRASRGVTMLTAGVRLNVRTLERSDRAEAVLADLRAFCSGHDVKSAQHSR